ncbi:MAG TPA: hypothetical protein VFZ41_01840 [Solirubrobacterales bacterium]
MDAHAEAAGLPDDADDLRGYYFKELIRKPLTQALVALAAIAAGVAGTAIFSPAIGAAAFAGGLLLALLIVFGIADSRSEEAFFNVYAHQRGMTASGKRPLHQATPLLRKGDDRYAERVLDGPLADGVEGLLALYTYEEQSTDSEGHTQTNYYRYTVGMTDVPECAGFVPELYCQQKFGLRALEKFEDMFRRSKERVKLESHELGERYEIFAGSGQDPNWLRQLFSPTFIVWLTDGAPDKFAFELVDGTLCCYVKGHRKSTLELDRIRDAAASVAIRLREESLE